MMFSTFFYQNISWSCSACSKGRQGYLRLNPQLGLPRLFAETWAASCHRWLWFRASLGSSTRMYSSSHSRHGRNLPSQIWLVLWIRIEVGRSTKKYLHVLSLNQNTDPWSKETIRYCHLGYHKGRRWRNFLIEIYYHCARFQFQVWARRQFSF